MTYWSDKNPSITYNSFRLDIGSWMVDDHISVGDEERPKLTDLPIDLAVGDLYTIKLSRFSLRSPKN